MVNEKPRLLHVINLNTAGGVEQLFSHMMEAADRIPPSDHFALIVGDHIHPFFKVCCERHLVKYFRAKHIGAIRIPKVPRFLRSQRIRRIIKESRPDTCLVWNRIIDSSLADALSVTSARCIYYEHGIAWQGHTVDPRRTLLPYCSKAIAVSRAAARVLQLRWSYKGEIETIHNGIRPDVIPARTTTRTLRPEKPLRLGMVGRLVPLKSPGTAIEILSCLQKQGHNCTLQIAGEGPLLPRLKQRAVELEIDEKVTFHGLVRDMSRLYDNIDLLLVPSVREPFGMIASEAAVRGCPAIVTRVDGLPEVVEDGVTGLTVAPTIDPGAGDNLGSRLSDFPEFVYNPDSDELTRPKFLNPTEVAARIHTLIASPDVYAKMSINGAERSRKKFSFDGYLEKLSNTLDNIYPERNQGSPSDGYRA